MGSNEQPSALWKVGDQASPTTRSGALARAESHLHWLGEMLPGFSYRRLTDPRATIQLITEGIERLSGCPASEFLGRDGGSLDELICEEDRPQVLKARQTAITNRTTYEVDYRMEHRLEGVRWVREQGRAGRSEEGAEYIDAYVNDQTEVKRLRTRDERRGQDFRKQQAALVSLVTSDAVAAGDFEEASRLATELLADAVGVARASSWVLRDQRSSLQLVTLFQSSTGAHESGTSLEATQYPSYFDAMNTGRLIDAHDARQDPRTSEFREGYLEPLGITSMLDVAVRVSGRVEGVVCLEHVGPPRTWSEHEIQFAGEVADQLAHALLNHERMRAEQRESELQEQLFFSQKMEAVGQLAGSVAHDFNNLLTIISGFAEELHENVKEASSQSDLEEILKAAKQGTELTAQLLAMSRRDPLELKAVNIADCVRELSQVLPKMLADDVTLSVQAPEQPVMVRASLGLVQQILTNLVVNAGHAMNNRGTVALKVEQIKPATPFEVVQGTLPTGRYGLLQVTDSGRGMDPGVLARIFEPFFTTRPRGTGTGLGLSTVYNIVSRCGGGLRVSSAVGVGTTFSIFLPVDDSDHDQVEYSETLSLDSNWAEGLEFVVVEDNAAVLGVIRNCLTRVGGHVTPANRPNQAISILQSWNNEETPGPHLVLTDMGMPGGGGSKLIRWLKAHRPDIPIAIVSGYVAHNQIEATEGLEILRKPFLSAELQDFVRDVLSGSTTSKS